jgi:parvulin-like peptidyl-prolyl isomerase
MRQRLPGGRFLVGLTVVGVLAGCGLAASPTPAPATPTRSAETTAAPTPALSPAVAKVNGVSITKDQLTQREKIEAFKLDDAESRTREQVLAGHMSAAQGQQILQYISQQQQQVASVALEDEIDTELVLQLAAKRNATASDAAIKAQITKDATTVESRHVYQIAIVPDPTAGTDAGVAAAQKKADGLVADLKAGKTWEDVVKESGDATAAANNGDLIFINQGSTSPDTAFVDAIFALAAPGYTDVIKGSDGTFRIGRLTEIAPEQVDPGFTQRISAAGISLDAYRRVDSAVVVGALIRAQLTAEVVDSASEQRQVSVMVLENNSGEGVLPGAVLVKHVLYSPNHNPSGASALKADDPAWATAKQEALDAVAKLKAGTVTFRSLAASSDDTGSGAANGFLPYFSKADTTTSLDPAFAAAIYAPGLVPGQLLSPVRSAFGWHVIEFVSAADPTTRATQLAAAASASGADFAKLAEENSIDPSARTGGSLGWVAKYQLAADQEAAFNALQADGVSAPIVASDGIRIFKVTSVQTRLPDSTQAATLKTDAFNNWYQSVKADPAQTTIERVSDAYPSTPTSAPFSAPTPKVDPSVGLKIEAPYTLAPVEEALATRFGAVMEQSFGLLLVDAQIGGRQIMNGPTFAGVVLVFKFRGTSLDDVPGLLDLLADSQASEGKVSKRTILETPVWLGRSASMYWAMYRRGESIVIVDASTATGAEALGTALIKANQ